MTTAPHLMILGVHVASDAYPNVRHKVRALRNLPGVKEINAPLAMERLFTQPQSRFRRIRTLFCFAARFVTAHLRVIFAYLLRPVPGALYVPYPAVFVLWLLSWLPRSRRAGRIVADVFISLHDTAATDRHLLKPGGYASRLLYRCERRAYQFADMIVADTELNAEYLRERFALSTNKVTSLPLSIDESIYAPTAYNSQTSTCTVLFVGTFVPLQGADVIAHAIKLLNNRSDITFRLIGNGQSAAQVESILASNGGHNWIWNREWQSAATLAAEISAADICLGIFGSGDKTQRVWPLKNYAYMAVGRALITAETHCAHELARTANEPPFVMVPPADPVALAAAISALAGDSPLRGHLATAGRTYYQQHLRAEISARKLQTLLAI